MNALEIVNIIKNEHFIIYGNGYVSKRLMHLIRMMKCESHVDAVVVTDISGNVMGVNDKPVESIYEVDNDSIVIIAAHDEIATEMLSVLNKLNIKKVIPIYHYLFDMELGEPLKKNVLIKVDVLIAHLAKGYMPAIYYLSLKDYCGDNIYNGCLYKKMCMHFTTEKTADKRWERYKIAIDKCRKYGFAQDYNIKVSKDYSVIDGLHRLTLAKYFGCDVLYADIYNCDEDFYSAENNIRNIYIQRNDLIKYYNKNEIRDIERTLDELNAK